LFAHTDIRLFVFVACFHCFGLQEKIRELRAEKNTFKAEFERVNAEYAVAVGHTNKKQRIHYVDSLKQQLNVLMEENASLRSKMHK
jgi:hypothetical protein